MALCENGCGDEVVRTKDDVPLCAGCIVAMFNEQQVDARLGRAVREIVGTYDLDLLGASEDISISDESEPDRYRTVLVVSEEQVNILDELAAALREEVGR